MAGAELRTLDDGEQWMLVPDEPAIRELLDAWTILHRPVCLAKRKPFVGVSPSFASLYCRVMPRRSAERITGCRNPAMGDILPLLYWDLLFADAGRRLPPFAGALPFCMSTRTFRRRDIVRTTLHRQAVCEHGITGVAFGLRDLMRRWYEEACAARQSQPSEPAEGAASEARGQAIVSTQLAPAPAV
jgi:hypothetical protein